MMWNPFIHKFWLKAIVCVAVQCSPWGGYCWHINMTTNNNEAL